ncbi:MAG: helix-turn-helix domain-containing protein [Crocinitomicaceae bacterium]
MKENKSKAILTRKEAAELLSVSLTTLKTWSDQKIIRAYKLGGRIYYKEKELLNALQSV